MYKLHITKKASKELKQISRFHKDAVIVALEDIKEDLLIGKALKRDFAGKYTYRLGMYRIIYMIHTHDKIITILTAAHRSVVYGN